jgi:invasion protein IalB
MPPICVSARSLFLAALMLTAFAGSVRAQEGELSAEAPAAEKARPKPKTKPKSGRPKTAPTAMPTPVAPSAPPPTATAAWPLGATSVSESYDDWTMTCVRPSEKVACVVAQSQGDSRTGRRRFGIELKPPQDGHAEGIVVMPFGLAIEPGITFKLDDQVLGKGAPYTSCTGEGCLVPISFPTLAIDGMRTAKILAVTGRKTAGATGIEAGDPATIAVPLAGFPQAFDRAMALSAH